MWHNELLEKQYSNFISYTHIATNNIFHTKSKTDLLSSWFQLVPRSLIGLWKLVACEPRFQFARLQRHVTRTKCTSPQTVPYAAIYCRPMKEREPNEHETHYRAPKFRQRMRVNNTKYSRRFRVRLHWLDYMNKNCEKLGKCRQERPQQNGKQHNRAKDNNWATK